MTLAISPTAVICQQPDSNSSSPVARPASRLDGSQRRTGPGRARPRPSGARGFTMAELLATIAIIGILAAASQPVFVRLMRDNRVRAAATNVADLYRTARARAMGRGSCVCVRWEQGHAQPTAADPAGHFTMREAIMGGAGNCAPMAAPNCVTTDWAANSTNSRFVMSFDERAPRYEPAQAGFVDPDNNATAHSEVCFSPRGRAFVRYAAAGAFTTLTGVARVEITNTTTSMTRQVIIPPTGAARVVSRVGP